MTDLRLTNFLGIEFGTKKEIVKEKILLRDGAIFDEENSSEDSLFFDGIVFGGRQTSFIYLLFIEDKFARAGVLIQPKLDAYAIATYSEIKNEINSKYYVTPDDFENYEEPYFENDGYTESGIQNGKIHFSSYWSFPNKENSKDDFISIKITEELQIMINYEDGDLSEQMASMNSQKNSEDY
jgi:hypothetical protein